ncbi:hypothetical protein [Anoxybacillus sp.]|uniref:hypothetical protein n=1 Tax=Anoxybacillus sp. TaxID=1872573 RepID=UPI002612C14D|nr:hypothetical protein [uncultured Anoxybacillus sp.]
METTGSVAIGAGGMLLNATGAGAVIGTPATAVAAVGVAHGTGLATAGGTGFVKSAYRHVTGILVNNTHRYRSCDTFPSFS